MEEILQDFGILCIERPGVDIKQIASKDLFRDKVCLHNNPNFSLDRIIFTL